MNNPNPTPPKIEIITAEDLAELFNGIDWYDNDAAKVNNIITSKLKHEYVYEDGFCVSDNKKATHNMWTFTTPIVEEVEIKICCEQTKDDIREPIHCYTCGEKLK